MRALVIAPQPFFTPRGTPFSVYHRALVAAEQGVRIDLLTYGEGADVAIPGVRIVRIPRLGFLGPVPVGPSFPKLFLDCWMVAWTIGLLLRRRYHFVHAHEEAVFWCRYLKPLFRFKLAYDMHSSLPQQLRNFQFSSSRLLERIFGFLERSALARSDAVIAICPALEDYALEQGVDRERLFLIENSVLDDVRLASGAEAGAEVADPPIELPNRPRVVYAGTFEPYQGIELLIRAFARVHQARPDVELLLAGGRPEQIAAMQTLAEQQGVAEACRFTGSVSRAAAGRYLAGATVLVSPRIEGTNTPLKLYEQLAMGKPLVATRIWAHTQVLDDDVCVLVEPSEQCLADGLLKAINEPHGAECLAANAKRLYDQAYSRARYEDKMRQFLEVLA